MNTFRPHPELLDVTIMEIRGNKIDGDIFVSNEDLPMIQKYTWYIKDAAQENHSNYVAAKIANKTTKLHRYLTGVTLRTEIVDHRDRNTFNNIRKNLRVVTSSINNHNTKTRTTNKSGKTGVYFKEGTIAKNGKKRSDSWVAQVRINGESLMKQFSLSVYGDKSRQMAEDWRRALEVEHGILTE